MRYTDKKKQSIQKKEDEKMKKILAFFLTCIIAFGFSACNNTAEEAPSTEEIITSMTAPIDALARCMLENDMEYDPENPDFFWTALYYFTGGYGLEHEQVEEIPDTYQLKVPKEVMAEHAIALFSDYTDLMELPSIMQGNISYDSSEDAYLISQGDIGLTKMILTDVKETEKGYTLRAELLSMPEEKVIGTWDVTLIRNTFAEEIENPLYLCSVSSMKRVEETAPVKNTSSDTTSGETITAIFNGLSDSHTVEVTLPDDSIQAFQFDAASDAGKLIQSLSQGDGFTFRYITDANTGASVILTAE